MVFSDAKNTSSSTNDLHNEDVERILMSLLSSSPLSNATTTTSSSERNRGGERDEMRGKNFVSERTMDILLREMRKMDRDRDRVLHPVQIKSLFSKYKVILVIRH